MTIDIGWGERKFGAYHEPNRIARSLAVYLHTVMPVNGRLWSGGWLSSSLLHKIDEPSTSNPIT
jgi:hypothetical protein